MVDQGVLAPGELDAYLAGEQPTVRGKARPGLLRRALTRYIENYYTTTVGQWIANDLRLHIYEHLHRLSLRYYDNVKTGALVSTITSDVQTI